MFQDFLLLLAAIVSVSSSVAIPVLLCDESVLHEANSSKVPMKTNNSTGAFFRRHSSVAYLDCSKVIAHDEKYIQQMAKQRVSYQDDPSLLMDCKSIRQRHYFADEPASEEEAAFPIAFSRAVYKVRFHAEKEKNGFVDTNKFDCSLGFINNFA
uniref:Uncharacterized protein n=1 Tax=Ditylenchus dipsaci TaxID=166011 RepID=A0A915EBP4_9BILA